MIWNFNDGGREKAGFRGSADDCVTRAIAIASNTPYREVYDELFRRQKKFVQTSRSKIARRARERGTSCSPRTGVFPEAYKGYLDELGWKWEPLMHIGSGCTVHLDADELPGGTIICRLSKHLTVVVDGVIQDTHDCSRDGTRCVYGYWRREDAGNG